MVFNPAAGSKSMYLLHQRLMLQIVEEHAIVPVVGETVVVGKGFTETDTLAAALRNGMQDLLPLQVLCTNCW